MNWLPVPVVPKRQWPDVRHKEKRSITLEEHQAIVAREGNSERRGFYELSWYLGASQSDVEHLEAENIDWEIQIISYPERFAQEALGHKSKAVHRAYARKAKVIVPALEQYEKPEMMVLQNKGTENGITASA